MSGEWMRQPEYVSYTFSFDMGPNSFNFQVFENNGVYYFDLNSGVSYGSDDEVSYYDPEIDVVGSLYRFLGLYQDGDRLLTNLFNESSGRLLRAPVDQYSPGEDFTDGAGLGLCSFAVNVDGRHCPIVLQQNKPALEIINDQGSAIHAFLQTLEPEEKEYESILAYVLSFGNDTALLAPPPRNQGYIKPVPMADVGDVQLGDEDDWYNTGARLAQELASKRSGSRDLDAYAEDLSEIYFGLLITGAAGVAGLVIPKEGPYRELHNKLTNHATDLEMLLAGRLSYRIGNTDATLICALLYVKGLNISEQRNFFDRLNAGLSLEEVCDYMRVGRDRLESPQYHQKLLSELSGEKERERALSLLDYVMIMLLKED